MTYWDFIDKDGVLMATVYSGAIAFLLATELLRDGNKVEVFERKERF